MAPVIMELKKYPDRIRSIVCVTGQHNEMLEQALKTFNIKPDFDLNIMKPEQSLSALTAGLINSLDSLISRVGPEWVLAQGDTTTVMATSLVTYYRRIKFGHVEAGLRTGDRWQPFPEEINRRIADLLADIYFAPTERAKSALLKEGCPPDKIFVTGNTVVDALKYIASLPYNWADGPLARIPEGKKLVLITAHRRENFGEKFKDICLALRDLALYYFANGDDLHFIYPVHLNPNIQSPVEKILSGLPNFTLTAPIDYISLVHLMKKSLLILTDSGGIQEETTVLRIPCLALREKTERPITVEVGCNRVVGTDTWRIIEAYRQVMNGGLSEPQLPPLWDGKASKRIVRLLLDRL